MFEVNDCRKPVDPLFEMEREAEAYWMDAMLEGEGHDGEDQE